MRVDFFDAIVVNGQDSDKIPKFKKLLTLQTDMVPAKGEMVQLPIVSGDKVKRSIIRRVMEVYNIYCWTDSSCKECECIIRVDLI